MLAMSAWQTTPAETIQLLEPTLGNPWLTGIQMELEYIPQRQTVQLYSPFCCIACNWKWLSDRRRRSKGEEHESARLKTLHQCNFKMQVLQKVCVKQLNQKNVRLLAAAGGVVGELRASLLRNSKGRGDLGPRGGRRGGREGGTAGRKVPPIKQWTLPAENKYNTTNHWQVLLQRLQNTTKTRQRRSSTSVISGATNVHNTYQFNHHLADSGVIWLMEGKTWVVVVVL